MGLESIKNQSSDLSKRTKSYVNDYNDFAGSVQKFEDIVTSYSDMDDSIRENLNELKVSYEEERGILELENSIINEERKMLSKTIEEQLSKLYETQNKLMSTRESKYGAGGSEALKTCQRLIDEYKSLLEQIKTDALTEFDDISQIRTNFKGETVSFTALEVDANNLLNSGILTNPTITTYNAGGVGVGWCTKNSMSAVSINADGEKVVAINIGGNAREFPCTQEGLMQAYSQTLNSGDQEMAVRCAAMFEVETFREMLELGSGDSSYVQMGGYYGDVKKQDPPGYNSHHIPSRAVQDVNADWLPTVSISEDDHKLTSSYAGKQKHVFQTKFNQNEPKITYKDRISQSIAQGSSGYINALKNEVYDLKSATGGRYDGGISAFLDAVIDMIATRGIPDAK